MKTKLLISQGARINVAEHDSRITIALYSVYETCYMYMVLKHTHAVSLETLSSDSLWCVGNIFNF